MTRVTILAAGALAAACATVPIHPDRNAFVRTYHGSEDQVWQAAEQVARLFALEQAEQAGLAAGTTSGLRLDRRRNELRMDLFLAPGSRDLAQSRNVTSPPYELVVRFRDLGEAVEVTAQADPLGGARPRLGDDGRARVKEFLDQLDLHMGISSIVVDRL